ncbi:MAG: hypothetical protein A4S09_04290 [Proteobacteria bacterium SG_bin7]|nr:MAG: hypothetical protein A4S09_04290 [Proteobacteria bacterium SG_bin7]
MKGTNNFLTILAILLIVVISFQNCAFIEPEHSTEASSVNLNALNFEGFKTTVFPVITQNCAGCHGSGVPGAPQFGVAANPESSFQILIQRNILLENVTPSQNLIVMKIIGGSHNGITPAIGQNMQNQVTAWQAGIP